MACDATVILGDVNKELHESLYKYFNLFLCLPQKTWNLLPLDCIKKEIMNQVFKNSWLVMQFEDHQIFTGCDTVHYKWLSYKSVKYLFI